MVIVEFEDGPLVCRCKKTRVTFKVDELRKHKLAVADDCVRTYEDGDSVAWLSVAQARRLARSLWNATHPNLVKFSTFWPSRNHRGNGYYPCRIVRRVTGDNRPLPTRAEAERAERLIESVRQHCTPNEHARLDGTTVVVANTTSREFGRFAEYRLCEVRIRSAADIPSRLETLRRKIRGEQCGQT